MKISFLLSSLWLSGGTQAIAEFANGLSRRGHSITLVAPQATLDPDLVQGITPTVSIRESHVAGGRDLGNFHKLRLAWSLARTVPPSDIIVSTHTPTTVSGFLAGKLWQRGNLIWLFLDYREMFAHRPVENWLMRHALRWHKSALVISEDSRRELLSFSPGNVSVVRIGLSQPELFYVPPLDQRFAPGKVKSVLFLGDARPRKGMAEFLQAAYHVHKEMNNLRWVLACKEMCHIESEVPFEVVARPTRAELARLYATSDVFVSASWREGFGLPPLEAMACGTPVVLTDSGGVREYARPEENCLMVAPRDPVALADALTRVLSDPVLARRLSQNGPPTAAQFRWDSAVQDFEQILKSLSGTLS
ncbi:MAG: glycosyltransferase family 4 protein [Anaerolineales bacterium]|nr:glycosyltransferase family 4 protein [Anaerolineales bacterium]